MSSGVAASPVRIGDALGSWWQNGWPVALTLIVTLLAAWIVYRLQRREEREGVLAALQAELELHSKWVGGQGYSSWSHDWWVDPVTNTEDWHKIVYKLSTVSTDNAIQVGPSLFIYHALVPTLVQYRQRAHQFNQLIDDVAAFRAAPDLWVPSQRQADLRKQLEILIEMVHMGGIADQNQYPFGANYAYCQVEQALNVERAQTRWRRWAWLWLGRTVPVRH